MGQTLEEPEVMMPMRGSGGWGEEAPTAAQGAVSPLWVSQSLCHMVRSDENSG